MGSVLHPGPEHVSQGAFEQAVVFQQVLHGFRPHVVLLEERRQIGAEQGDVIVLGEGLVGLQRRRRFAHRPSGELRGLFLPTHSPGIHQVHGRDDTMEMAPEDAGLALADAREPVVLFLAERCLAMTDEIDDGQLRSLGHGRVARPREP